VRFSDDTTGTALGSSTLSDRGIATIATSGLALGSHRITATYLGADCVLGSSASLTQAVIDIEAHMISIQDRVALVQPAASFPPSRQTANRLSNT
jgi:hypothetical protein